MVAREEVSNAWISRSVWKAESVEFLADLKWSVKDRQRMTLKSRCRLEQCTPRDEAQWPIAFKFGKTKSTPKVT